MVTTGQVTVPSVEEWRGSSGQGREAREATVGRTAGKVQDWLANCLKRD